VPLFSRCNLEACKMQEIITQGITLCFLSMRFTLAVPCAAFREEAGNKENRPVCRGELANDLTAQKWLRAQRGEFPGIETSSTRKCKPRQPASFPFSTTSFSYSSFSVSPGFLRRFLAFHFIRITWSNIWKTFAFSQERIQFFKAIL